MSSAAFGPSSSDKRLSVDIEQLMSADGLGPTDLYPGIDRSVGLYAVEVAKVRELNLEIEHQPILPNWYHGGVLNISSHGVRKKLAKAASAVIEIDQAAAQAFHEDRLVVEV